MLNRLIVFEDEAGLHVAMVNPISILRSVLMEDEKYLELANRQRQKLRTAVALHVPGKSVETQYGQFRKKGYIGPTMGVMAGGSFDGKIKEVLRIQGTLADYLPKIKKRMEQPGEIWGMHLAYSLELPTKKLALLGTTGPKMESKSFDIVKAGSNKARKKYSCPGTAYAAAYPIEVIVAEENGEVVVRLVEVMYRMKMFFEDAGKWAFAKNMTMPGSIQKEIERQIMSVTAE
ncbi:MAG: hypothetical protein Kow0042_30250 [Calditrichia bacterium]